MKAEKAEDRKLLKEIQEDYVNSPEWEEENAERIKTVQEFMPGGSYGAAKALVKRGPEAVDRVARRHLGSDYNDFKAIWDEIEKDGQRGPKISVKGGGWLTR